MNDIEVAPRDIQLRSVYLAHLPDGPRMVVLKGVRSGPTFIVTPFPPDVGDESRRDTVTKLYHAGQVQMTG